MISPLPAVIENGGNTPGKTLRAIGPLGERLVILITFSFPTVLAPTFRNPTRRALRLNRPVPGGGSGVGVALGVGDGLIGGVVGLAVGDTDAVGVVVGIMVGVLVGVTVDVTVGVVVGVGVVVEVGVAVGVVVGLGLEVGVPAKASIRPVPLGLPHPVARSYPITAGKLLLPIVIS